MNRMVAFAHECLAITRPLLRDWETQELHRRMDLVTHEANMKQLEEEVKQSQEREAEEKRKNTFVPCILTKTEARRIRQQTPSIKARLSVIPRKRPMKIEHMNTASRLLEALRCDPALPLSEFEEHKDLAISKFHGVLPFDHEFWSYLFSLKPIGRKRKRKRHE
jgi:hypothetical protein